MVCVATWSCMTSANTAQVTKPALGKHVGTTLFERVVTAALQWGALPEFKMSSKFYPMWPPDAKGPDTTRMEDVPGYTRRWYVFGPTTLSQTWPVWNANDAHSHIWDA